MPIACGALSVEMILFVITMFLRTLILSDVASKKYNTVLVLSADMGNVFDTSDAAYDLSQVLSISHLYIK